MSSRTGRPAVSTTWLVVLTALAAVAALGLIGAWWLQRGDDPDGPRDLDGNVVTLPGVDPRRAAACGGGAGRPAVRRAA